ncbi:MAG TPA: hypothetical protein VN894_06245, partial [Polyangiaceae bacterium]|nr:hypothetical protein [Polyangiaceae bacterium]
VQTLLALTSGLPPPPLPATVPGPIANLVRRALEPAPANRFATAAEMQQAIEEAMVATKVGTGTAAVAGFLSGHLAERARTRKEMIRLGLQAAADREMYASLLCSSVQTMATGATSRAMGDGLLPQALGPSGDSAVTGGTLGSAAMGLVPRRIARNRDVDPGGRRRDADRHGGARDDRGSTVRGATGGGCQPSRIGVRRSGFANRRPAFRIGSTKWVPRRSAQPCSVSGRARRRVGPSPGSRRVRSARRGPPVVAGEGTVAQAEGR